MARAKLHNVDQNLVFVYNVLGVPIASCVLHPLAGFLIPSSAWRIACR